MYVNSFSPGAYTKIPSIFRLDQQAKRAVVFDDRQRCQPIVNKPVISKDVEFRTNNCFMV